MQLKEVTRVATREKYQVSLEESWYYKKKNNTNSISGLFCELTISLSTVICFIWLTNWSSSKYREIATAIQFGFITSDGLRLLFDTQSVFFPGCCCLSKINSRNTILIRQELLFFPRCNMNFYSYFTACYVQFRYFLQRCKQISLEIKKKNIFYIEFTILLIYSETVAVGRVQMHVLSRLWLNLSS